MPKATLVGQVALAAKTDRIDTARANGRTAEVDVSVVSSSRVNNSSNQLRRLQRLAKVGSNSLIGKGMHFAESAGNWTHLLRNVIIVSSVLSQDIS